MQFDLWPTTQELADLFTEEVGANRGNVTSVYRDEQCLLARGVLPAARDVGPGDRVQGGVALFASEAEVRVHPYVFRQVCSNGAIFAQTLGTVVVERDDCAFVVAGQIRDAIGTCCGDEAFAQNAALMRRAKDAPADMAINLMPFLSRMPERSAQSLIAEILRRFRREKDRSRFGLMNAVTSTARDTRDPKARWQLEDLGGGIAAGLVLPPPQGGSGAPAPVARQGRAPLLVS